MRQSIVATCPSMQSVSSHGEESQTPRSDSSPLQVKFEIHGLVLPVPYGDPAWIVAFLKNITQQYLSSELGLFEFDKQVHVVLEREQMNKTTYHTRIFVFRQTTSAAFVSKSTAQTVPQTPWCRTSTRPDRSLLPFTSRTLLSTRQESVYFWLVCNNILGFSIVCSRHKEQYYT